MELHDALTGYTRAEDSQPLQVQMRLAYNDLSSGSQLKSTIFNKKCWQWKHIQWKMHLNAGDFQSAMLVNQEKAASTLSHK